MTTSNPQIKSILAVDCGTTTTTVTLIELIEDHYQLVAVGQARSTHGSPWHDMSVGFQRAAQQIEQENRKTLLAQGSGWPIVPRNANQQGVDAFIVVTSAGVPLPVTLVGLTKEISLTSARRAAATTYTLINNEFALDRPLANGQRSPEARMQVIRDSRPETILLMGGADGGADQPVVELAHLISMALRVSLGSAPPDILFAGNAEIRDLVTEILHPVARLKVIDNVRPTLDTENLAIIQQELEQLYVERKMSQLPGLNKLKNWSRLPIIPTSRSFEKVITYLGEQNNLNVVGLDIGSRTSMLSSQARGQHNITIRPDAGVGHSLATLLKLVPIEKIHRWLPFELNLESLQNKLLNKSLHPSGLPNNEEDLLIDYAIAREAMRLVVGQAQSSWPSQMAGGRRAIQWDLLIGAGLTLTKAPHFGYSTLLLLDGFEPWGVTKLSLDLAGLTSVLGSVAAIEPVAAVEVIAHESSFLNLGTIIAPLGHGVAGKDALNLKLIDEEEVVTEFSATYGTIQLIPLAPGKKATLEIRPTRTFDIGLGQPGRGAVAEVEGGLLGLIVDARGRPLRLPDHDEIRQAQLQQWLTSVGVKR
jgi:uncharacterized protein (TIGR01319 family)